MEIILAAPRGFCAGVERAIKIVDVALAHLPQPVYVNHEIVHNAHVIKSFKDKGVIFVEGLQQVPDGASLIFNAHGVPPELVAEAKRRGMKTVDATCPLVSKVHAQTLRYARLGCHILLIGHAGHPEVIGVMGEAPANITLVESVQDVARLEFPPEAKLAYVTQTTLSVDDCTVVIQALRERFPDIIEPAKADICYATTNRQEAIKDIAARCDLLLIVGSRNSSNSNRLREVAQNSGGRAAYLVNCPADIDLGWFRAGCERIGISAGASTPEHVVQAVITHLQAHLNISTVTEVITREETEHFPLPANIRF